MICRADMYECCRFLSWQSTQATGLCALTVGFTHSIFSRIVCSPPLPPPFIWSCWWWNIFSEYYTWFHPHMIGTLTKQNEYTPHFFYIHTHTHTLICNKRLLFVGEVNNSCLSCTNIYVSMLFGLPCDDEKINIHFIKQIFIFLIIFFIIRAL